MGIFGPDPRKCDASTSDALRDALVTWLTEAVDARLDLS
jgi:hypothetical protein